MIAFLLTVPVILVLTSSRVNAQTFPWANGIFLQGSMLSEMKVTSDDVSEEGSPGGSFTCDPGTATWPYTTTDLENYYDPTTSPLFDGGLWSLNSALGTFTTMLDTKQNLYIADVNGGYGYIPTSGTLVETLECNWYSLAALNDTIQFYEDFYAAPVPLYTGFALGVGAVHDHWACTYDDFIERARLEADEHPDVFKVVVLDELWRLMDGPDTDIYQGWEDPPSTDYDAHWTSANVEVLFDMTRGVYSGQDQDIDSAVDSACPSSPTTLGGSDVELWSRMIDVGLPRYIVPSAVLGVPADPDYIHATEPSGGWPTGEGYDLLASNNDALSVEMTVLAADMTATELSAYEPWTAGIEFL